MQEFDIEFLRAEYPRFYKAVATLYPFAWDNLLREAAKEMRTGKTAARIMDGQPIFRGLSKLRKQWIRKCLAADRKDILRRQPSFLTAIHEKPWAEIVYDAEQYLGLHSETSAEPVGYYDYPPDEPIETGFTFISHHSDSTGPLALRIAEALELIGRKCWVAPRDVHDFVHWNDEVFGAAQACGSLVLLLSKEAYRSSAVKGEAAIVVARSIPVSVVKLTDDNPAKVNIGLAAFQHIDWIGKRDAETPILIERLSTGISNLAA